MKRTIIMLSILILTISQTRAFSASDTLCTPNPSKEAVALYRYLQDMFGKKTLTGQMWTPLGWGTDELGYIKTHTGKQPAILGIDFINESENSLGVTKALSYAKSGGIITAMWHQGAPSVGEGYDNSKATIVIDSCFVPGTKAYKDYWAGLKKKADWLQKFKDANVPVLWRPYHELNGGWFWWSKQGPEKFKQLWDTMYNYFVYERGLNNLIWVLCYDGSPDAKWYPGKQYVDIAGGDTYGVGSTTQIGIFNQVKKIMGKDTVPIVYHECGVPPDPDLCLVQGATWSWWMEWHTTWLTSIDTAYLRKIYNHDLEVTLDKVPNIMAQYGWNADSCKPSVIVPKVMVDNGPWQQTNSIHIGSGTNAKLNVQVTDAGLWNWNGLETNGSAIEQTVAITNLGVATAIFKNSCGATSTQTFNIVECTSTAIIPYLQVTGDVLKNVKSVVIKKGNTVTLSPRPEILGTWSWRGGGTSGTAREQTITPDSSCIATVVYTNDCDKTSSLFYNITVEGNSLVKPSSNGNLDVTLYPAPCKESLQVDLNQLHTNSSSLISVYTMQGTLVLRKLTDVNSITINTSGLQPGMYIFSIVNNDYKISKRFLKVE